MLADFEIAINLADFWVIVLVLGIVTLCGYALRRIVGKRIAAVCAEADVARRALEQLHQVADSMREEVCRHQAHVLAVHQNLASHTSGEHASLDLNVEKLMAANVQLQGELATADQQLRQQAREIRTHSVQARTDALTKLTNRRGFDDELSRRLAEWQRRGRPFCLMMLDIDRFKCVNDTHGHVAGDTVLQHVAAALIAAVREMDFVARPGGEEFAVIMPDTLLAEARVGADRVRRQIGEMKVHVAGCCVQVTVSQGLAQVLPSDDAASLLKRADSALYAAKQAGRDRSYFHDGNSSLPLEQITAETLRGGKGEAVTGAGASGVSPSGRQSLLNDVARRIAECQRTGFPLTLLMFEVDQAEDLADRYGSKLAREVGESVADYVKSTLREMDTVVQLSPTLVAAMLPGTLHCAATCVAQRIQHAISQGELALSDEILKVTVSVGVAQYLPADDARALTDRVADAVAEAIEAGPNELRIHDGRCSTAQAVDSGTLS